MDGSYHRSEADTAIDMTSNILFLTHKEIKKGKTMNITALNILYLFLICSHNLVNKRLKYMKLLSKSY